MRKRIMAIVLAFVLVFGLNVTSFASTTKTVTVKVENPNYKEAIWNQQSTDGIPQYLINTTVVVPDDVSQYANLISNANTVENYGTATAMDALIKALNDSTLVDKTINCSRVQYTAWDEEAEDYVLIDRYGVAFSRYSSYSQVSYYDPSIQKTVYKYWQTNYNGNVTADYATAYTLSDNDVVEIKWDRYVW